MRIFLAALCATCLTTPALAGPVIVLNDRGGVGEGTQARQAFSLAAQRFANIFANDVTINLDVSFRDLGSGVLGATSTNQAMRSYASVRSALLGRASSAADLSAAPFLTSSLSFLSHEAGNCATDVDCRLASTTSRTRDADGTFDNLNLSVTSANSKVLGLIDPNFFGRDGGITFSSRVAWDFDPSDGITRGQYDFVGVATHEIAHALGFLSGIDRADLMMLDPYVGMFDNGVWGMPLDLFRYTGTERDWTIGGAPCLSANGGATCIGPMATGIHHGNGRQASHWLRNTTGLMAPSTSTGRLMAFTAFDQMALDLIGWNVLSAGAGGTLDWTYGGEITPGELEGYEFDLIAAPSAPMTALFGLGALGLAVARRRPS